MHYEIGYRLKSDAIKAPYNTPYFDFATVFTMYEATAIVNKMRKDFPNAEFRIITDVSDNVVQISRCA